MIVGFGPYIKLRGGGREENISIKVRIFWASRNDALTAAKRLREKTNKQTNTQNYDYKTAESWS